MEEYRKPQASQKSHQEKMAEIFAAFDDAPAKHEKKSVNVPIHVRRHADPSPYVVHVAPTESRKSSIVHHEKTTSVNLLSGTRRTSLLHFEEEHTDLVLTKEDLALLQSEGEQGRASQEPDITITIEHQGSVPEELPLPRHPFSVRNVIIFAVAAALFVAPIKAVETGHALMARKTNILIEGKSALQSLETATRSLQNRDPQKAAAALEHAEAKFQSALRLAGINDALLAVASITEEGRMAASGKELLIAAEAATKGAARLAAVFAAENEPKTTLTKKIAALEAALKEVAPYLHATNQALANVNASALPSDVPLEKVRLASARAEESLPALQKAASLSRYLLGDSEPRRYLLVFQNNNELRPTGGFIGSFALLDVRDGAIVNLEIPGDGSYNLQGRMRKLVEAPEPLRLINPRWEFQDANWFPDFPTSAKKLNEFYEKSGGPTVDGVIAVNARFVADLLEILGPTEIAEGKAVDGARFMTTAQQLAEFEYDTTENKPKAFLGTLAPKILAAAQDASSETLLHIADLLSKSLRNKDIQISLQSETPAEELRALGWDGAQAKTDGDYLAIVNSNIGGGKTDGVITETIKSITNISEDGSIERTVVLTRVNAGDPGDVFTKENNVTYHRIYVPEGAALIEATGFIAPPKELFQKPESYLGEDATLVALAKGEEVDEKSGVRIGRENGYSVFGGWTQVGPGQQATIRFTYRLPGSIIASRQSFMHQVFGTPTLGSYSTTFDLQSGTNRTLEHRVVLPASWNVVWHDGNARIAGGGYEYRMPLDHTIVTSLLFRK